MQKNTAWLLLLLCLAGLPAGAQSSKTTVAGQGLKGKVHWLKRSFHKPLVRGSAVEPDMTVPLQFTRPNTLMEFAENGSLRSSMTYPTGSNEESGATLRYFYKDGRLVKEEFTTADYQPVYTTTFEYDAAGHQVKSVTTRGPGDQLGITTDEQTEYLCDAAGCVQKKVVRNKAGDLQRSTDYTYDAGGHRTGETFDPPGLYAAIRYTLDKAGRVVTETSLDKENKPVYIVTNTYDAEGRVTRRIALQLFKGVRQSERVTTSVYNAQGDKIEERDEEGERKTVNTWQHTYDAQGNRTRTVHLTNGVAREVEVQEIRYYP